MFADYHVHTYYSDDCDCPMAEMLERAKELHIEEIAFTDHVDYGVKTGKDNCDYERYFAEISEREEELSGIIRIKRGIEFGVQLHTAAAYEKDFKRYPFDFVIMSNHQIGDKGFWNQKFQTGKTQDEYQRAYYEELLKLTTAYKNYSVLGHPDLIKRYDKCGDYPDSKIIDIVEAILKQVISDGKGIEVNTSCFHYGLKDLTPSTEILKLYRELGGEILTIGSDAHSTKYLGDRIPEVKERLKDIGFKAFCTFTRMKPEFHSL